MFLTIVTRCCQRPKMLGENIRSVLDQAMWQQVEQVFIPDHKRKGIHVADKALDENKDRVDGDWVYILDDDCFITDTEFITRLYIVAHMVSPDIIMIKSRRPPGPPSHQSIVPVPEVWGKKLRHGSCNCLCYIMRNELWKKHIHHFGRKAWGGDWWFLESVLSTNPSIYWLDRVMADARQLGRGRQFETKSKDWFAPVAEQYSIEEVGEGDWRLRLWEKDIKWMVDLQQRLKG